MYSLLTSSIERLLSSGIPTRTRTTPTLPKSLKNAHKLTRSSRIPRSAKYTTTTVSNSCSEAVVHRPLQAPGARGTRLPVGTRASTLAVWVVAAEEAAPFTSKRMGDRRVDLSSRARTTSSRNSCATAEWAWAAACQVWATNLTASNHSAALVAPVVTGRGAAPAVALESPKSRLSSGPCR